MATTLAQVWDGLLHRRARNTLTVPLVSGETPGPIQAGSGYFQVRLAEMYLQYDTQLWQKLAPATLFVCDFKYGSKDVRVPFFVSNQLLSGLCAGGGSLDKTRVRFRDTQVLGPVPYVGGDVGLFAGLFRTVIQDNRKALFSIFEKLFGASYASGLASYVQLAEKVSDELLYTLGMGDVECVLAERNVFGTSVRPLASGYLAMLDCEQDKLGGMQLSVVDGSLHVASGKSTRPMDLCDYCLLRIETSNTRDDVTTLPFHKKWKDAQAKIVRRQLPEAKAALMECQAALLESDDLTEDHKYRLVEFYQAAFFKDQQRFADGSEVAPIRTAVDVTRGQGGTAGAALELQQLGNLVRRQPKQIRDSVDHIKRLFEAKEAMPAAVAAMAGLGDSKPDPAWEQAIQQHLRTSDGKNDRAAAGRLVQALTAAMVTAQSSQPN